MASGLTGFAAVNRRLNFNKNNGRVKNAHGKLST